MRARQLIFEAAGPERLKVFLKAFDEAWDTIAGNFGDDPELVEAARAKLAKVILNLPISDTSVEAIKIAALQVMALTYRERPG